MSQCFSWICLIISIFSIQIASFHLSFEKHLYKTVKNKKDTNKKTKKVSKSPKEIVENKAITSYALRFNIKSSYWVLSFVSLHPSCFLPHLPLPHPPHSISFHLNRVATKLFLHPSFSLRLILKGDDDEESTYTGVIRSIYYSCVCVFVSLL